MEIKAIISALQDNGFTRTIHANIAPQEVGYPYVLVFLIDGNPSRSTDNAVEFEDVRIQLSVFAETYEEIATISQEIYNILNGYSDPITGLDYDHIVYDSKRDLPDDSTKGHHRALDYKMYVNH